MLQGLIDIEQEGIERQRLYTELDRMYELERSQLEQCEWGPNPAKNDGDSDDSDDDAALPVAMRAELAALDRKYRNLKRQVGEDPLLFVDNVFSLTPMDGTVWAHSSLEVTISFTPDVASEYACSAFLEVVGREARLPLQLRGTGIGPKAVFSYDVIDIGDVFVSSSHRCDAVVVGCVWLEVPHRVTLRWWARSRMHVLLCIRLE